MYKFLRFSFGGFSIFQRTLFVRFLAALGCLFAVASPRAHEARFFRIVGPGPTAITGITQNGYVAWTNAQTNVTCVFQIAKSLFGETDWADYAEIPVSNHLVTARIFDLNSPPGMVFVPDGSFMMGDTFGEGAATDRPAHTVYVSAICVDAYEVTKMLWDDVHDWAVAHGYSFEFGAQGKAHNHPALTTWYDAVKWCNARSEKEGRTPAYYTNAEQTAVYRTGKVDLQNNWVRWNTGYRLPTEAEWEKAARGGAKGRRFPWSDSDSITHTQANYYSHGSATWIYDISSTQGYHPTYAIGDYPYTSPVGSFAANGYELFDMSGNAYEWCWDWHDGRYYSSSPVSNPYGPLSPKGGLNRSIRDGGWGSPAYDCRTARRFAFVTTREDVGFRSVLPPSQP